MTQILRRTDDGWPPRLDEGLQPPLRSLFLRGRPLDPSAAMIAVVGTRRPTAAGIAAAGEIATGLALAGYTIVSGLAVGIDAVAHRAALDAGGTTVAVLGCGHDIDYPKRNRALRRRIEAEGTVVTEYAPVIEPKPFMFPHRNRIIAGLAVAVVVIEGTIQSGALVTARLALDANRDVYAVPGSVRNVMAQGPNELIRRGEAALVTRSEHVLEGLGALLAASIEETPAPPVELTPAQGKVLSYLDDTPDSTDRIIGALGLTAKEAGSALSMLELQGLATRTLRGYAITDEGARLRKRVFGVAR